MCVNEAYVWKLTMQWNCRNLHSKALSHGKMPEDFRITLKEWRTPTGKYTLKDLLGNWMVSNQLFSFLPSIEPALPAFNAALIKIRFH